MGREGGEREGREVRVDEMRGREGTEGGEGETHARGDTQHSRQTDRRNEQNGTEADLFTHGHTDDTAKKRWEEQTGKINQNSLVDGHAGVDKQSKIT